MGKKLSSKKEIMDYVELSWPSILKEKIPFTKIGGRIMSHTDLIDEHIKARVNEKISCQISEHAK